MEGAKCAEYRVHQQPVLLKHAEWILRRYALCLSRQMLAGRRLLLLRIVSVHRRRAHQFPDAPYLLCVRYRVRPQAFSRAQIERARVVALQLGAVISRLTS